MDVLVQKVNSGVTFTPKGRGRPGSQIRLDDHAVLTNRAGQYDVDHR